MYSYSRGSRERALAIASDPVAVRQAEQALENDEYAAGSRAAQNARQKLWDEICERMGVHDPLQLTPQLVRKAAGVLRAAGYRTAMAHVDQAMGGVQRRRRCAHAGARTRSQARTQSVQQRCGTSPAFISTTGP